MCANQSEQLHQLISHADTIHSLYARANGAAPQYYSNHSLCYNGTGSTLPTGAAAFPWPVSCCCESGRLPPLLLLLLLLLLLVLLFLLLVLILLLLLLLLLVVVLLPLILLILLTLLVRLLVLLLQTFRFGVGPGHLGPSEGDGSGRYICVPHPDRLVTGAGLALRFYRLSLRFHCIIDFFCAVLTVDRCLQPGRTRSMWRASS